MPPTAYENGATGRADGRFSEWLREAAEPTWSEAASHRFTPELAGGTLSDAVMGRYLVEDYAFLDSFVRLTASAIVKAPSLADRVFLGRFLGAVTGEENTYFQRAFDALGVPAEDRVRPVLRGPTLGFHELVAGAIAETGYPETLTPLVVFEWLYNAWASAFADRRPERFYHREWIALHANPEFDSFVAWLRAQLDFEGPTLAPERQGRIVAAVRRAVALEKAFFEDAHAPQ